MRKREPHPVAEDAWTFERKRLAFCNDVSAHEASLLLADLMSRRQRPPKDSREEKPAPPRR